MSSIGFLNSLALLLRLRDYQAWQHFGTVCSTWVWMSRSVTKRSDESLAYLLNVSVSVLYELLASSCAYLFVCSGFPISLARGSTLR